MTTIKNETDLSLTLSKTTSVVLAKTRTCSVCGAIKERLEYIEDYYKDVFFSEIYIEDVPTFSGQHLVFTVPTVLVFYEGKEILRESRFVSVDNVVKVLNKIKDN